MSEREQITVTYCGRRLGNAAKLVYEFEYAGRSLVFAKMNHGVVGGRYTVDADVSDDGVSIYPVEHRSAPLGAPRCSHSAPPRTASHVAAVRHAQRSLLRFRSCSGSSARLSMRTCAFSTSVRVA